MTAKDRHAADAMAARATATGVALLAFMVSWLLGARVFGLLWPAPVGPVVALVTAVLLAVTAGVAFRRRVAG